jgi:hypothetical protein
MDSEIDYWDLSGFGMLDLLQEYHLKVYHARELKMFHCKRAWKIPLIRLELRMLIKFLCKSPFSCAGNFCLPK